MKPLIESLFDKDLVKKEASVDFETLRDMLFDFGRKRKNLFDKIGGDYHMGRQTIYFRRYIDTPGGKNSVCFELEIGVTNIYDTNKKLSPGFICPKLKSVGKMNIFTDNNYDDNSNWNYSSSNIYSTLRLLGKKDISYYEDSSLSSIKANVNNISKTFELYDKMVNYFCSNDFKKELQNYVNKFEFKHAIPGIVMDILMKKLITKS